jgi:hypothetical protein
MVLLHYHVVPGLGEDSRPRPEASAIRNDQVAPANDDDFALAATRADHPIPPTPVEAVRAA